MNEQMSLDRFVVDVVRVMRDVASRCDPGDIIVDEPGWRRHASHLRAVRYALHHLEEMSPRWIADVRDEEPERAIRAFAAAFSAHDALENTVVAEYATSNTAALLDKLKREVMAAAGEMRVLNEEAVLLRARGTG